MIAAAQAQRLYLVMQPGYIKARLSLAAVERNMKVTGGSPCDEGLLESHGVSRSKRDRELIFAYIDRYPMAEDCPPTAALLPS